MHAEAALEERLDLHPVELGQTLVEHRVALDLVGAGGDNGHAQQLAPIQGRLHLRPRTLEECLQSGQVLAGLIVVRFQQNLHIEAHEGHAELYPGNVRHQPSFFRAGQRDGLRLASMGRTAAVAAINGGQLQHALLLQQFHQVGYRHQAEPRGLAQGLAGQGRRMGQQIQHAAQILDADVGQRGDLHPRITSNASPIASPRRSASPGTTGSRLYRKVDSSAA